MRASLPYPHASRDKVHLPAFEPQAAGAGAVEGDAVHGRGDGAADEAVEPVVVELRGLDLPLVDGSAAALGLDAVLGAQVLGEEPVRLGPVAEEREASLVAHGDAEAGVDERLPVVGVVDDVAHSPAAGDARDAPVVADAVAALSASPRASVRAMEDHVVVRLHRGRELPEIWVGVHDIQRQWVKWHDEPGPAKDEVRTGSSPPEQGD